MGDGIYSLRGTAEGYAETKYGSAVTTSGSGASSKNIKLTADANWSSKLKSKPMTPASGGTVDDSLSTGTGVKLVVPPNALGSGTSSGNIKTNEINSVSKTSSAQPLGSKGKEITAQDNSGQAITSLNDDIEIELNYYKEDITEAGMQDLEKLKQLTNSYWDSSVGDWVPMPTTKKAFTKENANDAEWTSQDDFVDFVDNMAAGSATYADYKITLQSTSSHLTIFGATIPADLSAPAVPIGLSQTSGSGTSVVLNWDDNTEADLLEYEIYRSTSSGVTAVDANQVNASQVSTSTFTDSATTAWTSYYYTVTAADDSGNESAVAAEIQVCSNKTVSNGTVAVSCAITCNSGYTLSGNSCTSSSSGSSGGGYVPVTTPPTNTSIVIAGGAANSLVRAVTLTLAATGATQMAVSNAVDFAGVSWETYAASKSWTLTEGDGVKTVYVKFRDAEGDTSVAVSDTITLGNSIVAETPVTPITPASISTYPDGTLIKSDSAPEVYVIKDGKRVWIPNAQAFISGGYKWENIQVVSGEVIKQVGAATLVRVAGDTRVYVIVNNSRRHIKSAEEFNSQGYKWADIVTVSAAELDAYPESGAAAVGGKTIVVIATSLRIRSANSTTGKALGWIKINEKYSVLDENNGWYKITSKAGIIGWVSGQYAITTTADTNTAPALNASGNIIINNAWLRVRSISSTKGTILGYVNKGEAYAILGAENGWYKIKTKNAKIGWVSGEYAVKQ